MLRKVPSLARTPGRAEAGTELEMTQSSHSRGKRVGKLEGFRQKLMEQRTSQIGTQTASAESCKRCGEVKGRMG